LRVTGDGIRDYASRLHNRCDFGDVFARLSAEEESHEASTGSDREEEGASVPDGDISAGDHRDLLKSDPFPLAMKEVHETGNEWREEED
jgi:hypothetical protein